MLKFKRRAIRHAQQFGLPEDVLLGLPRLVMHGNTSLSLENHKGVLEYTPTRIRLRTGIGTLTIQGEGMSLAQMGRHDMLLRGAIQSVGYGT
ncbi:MAG: sporulation protein YqfC [Oscillospiraceae bacterium]|nr:sporulation protein YqfC [Oscillospiraceae bacterium]